MALLVPLVLLALMWVFLILPQQRRVKEHKSFVAGLSVGDAVVTTSGVYGTIRALDAETALLQVAPGVEITIARMAIGQPQPSFDEPALGTQAPDSDDPTE